MTYQTQHIEVELRSPLLLGTDQEYAIFLETRDYIPGSVLRGSLARLLQESGTQAQLDTLFSPTITQPIFEHLYPVTGGANTFSQPLPLSARSCKYNGGFQEPGSSKYHGIGDILIRQSVFEQALSANARLPFLYRPVCPECQAEVERPNIRFYETIGATYRSIRAPVRRLARSAINRRRYTAADQLLYTLETIEPGWIQGHEPKKLIFRGAVHYQEEHKPLLESYLPQIQWLGRGRSRGLGQISLRLNPEGPEQPALEERVEAFNRKVWEEWRFYERVAGLSPPPEDTVFFSIGLLSPAVFSRGGLPSTEPDLGELGFEAGQQATIQRAFTDQHILGGWHLGANLPRRTMLATAAGSVYMTGVQGLSPGQLADLLKPIEIIGLGQERERGLGRVTISSLFHYQPEVIL